MCLVCWDRLGWAEESAPAKWIMTSLVIALVWVSPKAEAGFK